MTSNIKAVVLFISLVFGGGLVITGLIDQFLLGKSLTTFWVGGIIIVCGVVINYFLIRPMKPKSEAKSSISWSRVGVALAILGLAMIVLNPIGYLIGLPGAVLTLLGALLLFGVLPRKPRH